MRHVSVTRTYKLDFVVGVDPRVVLSARNRDVCQTLVHELSRSRGQSPRDKAAILALIAEMGDKAIAEVDQIHVPAWVNQRRTQLRSKTYVKKSGEKRTVSLPPVAEGTVTRDIATHQAIWQQAIEEGILTSNPWRSIDREGYESRDRVLSLDEEPRLKAAVSLKMARFVDFALGTGGRLEEVRTAQMDLAAGTVRFHGKFDKVRTVRMLTPESIAAARVQIETEGKLWTMNPQHFRDVLARAAKRLGIPHLSPHTLRHTFATRFLQAGGDIYVLSKLLGHSSSVSITERHYAHVVDADIIARARQIRLPSPEGATEGAPQSATPARRRRAS
jgi:integrase